jgi:DNA-binding transcriptional ArsR family regulator
MSVVLLSTNSLAFGPKDNRNMATISRVAAVDIKTVIKMGKNGETKLKIITILKSGKKTPAQLTAELGLAPSTISQHIKELERMGLIDRAFDEHFRNISYCSVRELISNGEVLR